MNGLRTVHVPQPVKKFLHPLPKGGTVVRVAQCAVA